MRISTVNTYTHLATRNAPRRVSAAQAAHDEASAAEAVVRSAIASSEVSSQNLAASESRIAVTEMPVEMAAYTKDQIMMQTGTTMLAQTNAIPRTILELLR